jgi:hypothetical protein
MTLQKIIAISATSLKMADLTLDLRVRVIAFVKNVLTIPKRSLRNLVLLRKVRNDYYHDDALCVACIKITYEKEGKE